MVSRLTGRPAVVAGPSDQTPVNGVGALLAQQAVGAAERSRTDESPASGQRRRVRALDARNISQRELNGLRVSAPQDGYQRSSSGGQGRKRLCCHGFPALAAMTAGSAWSDGQYPVEQHHAAVSPSRQVSVPGSRKAEIG